MRGRPDIRCQVAAAAVAVAIGVGCGGESPQVVENASPAPDSAAKLSPELRALQRQAGQLLDGGTDAFEARLEKLRGYPVVVNQWASWCGPCRFEFPFFQRLAVKYAGREFALGG